MDRGHLFYFQGTVKYEDINYQLRVNGPHNVGDPHNAGLGK